MAKKTSVLANLSQARRDLIYILLQKKKAKYLVKDPYFLPLQRLGKLLAISNNNKKAKIFTERFFP